MTKEQTAVAIILLLIVSIVLGSYYASKYNTERTFHESIYLRTTTHTYFVGTPVQVEFFGLNVSDDYVLTMTGQTITNSYNITKLSVGKIIFSSYEKGEHMIELFSYEYYNHLIRIDFLIITVVGIENYV